mgnify:CR=1 FL=1
MNSEQLDLILAVIVSLIFLTTMTIVTYMVIRAFILHKLEKKDIENSKYLLNDKWEIISTNNKGVPLLFRKKEVFISLNDVKKIKVKNNAKI